MYNKFILVLILMFTGKIIFGQSGPALITLTPSSQTVYLNEPTSVVVGVDDVVGLFAISITLSFDNSIIKCLDITQGNFLVNNSGGYDVFFETFPEDLYSANTVIVDQSILGNSSVSGTGDVFEITFEPFAGGTSQIEIVSFSLRDINNQEIPAIAEFAEVSVIPTVAAVITLTPPSQLVSTNDPVSVVVGVDGVVGLFAISVTVSFDNSIIKCLDITQGNFLVNNSGGYNVFYETYPEDLYSSSTVIIDQSILGIGSVSGTGDVFEIVFEPFAGGTSQVEVISFSLRDLNNQEIPAFAETAEITVNASSVVNSKIFLQGPYNSVSGSMMTTLNSSGYIPLNQPYSSAPWNYPGSESVPVDFFINHPDIVDWVLVELRTDIAANTTAAIRACFIKSDGVIVDLDGSSPVSFVITNSVDYYIVINHRNHLSVMTSSLMHLSTSTPLYDFTVSQSQAYGANAMKDLGGGNFGLFAGDANGNEQIQNNDSETYWAVQNGQSGYREGDFNLNGQVQNNDRETFWAPNNGRGSQVPN